MQEGRCEEIEEERPEGGVLGRDIWWHGAPGGRSSKCRRLRQPGESRSSPQAQGSLPAAPGCIRRHEGLRAPDRLLLCSGMDG